MNEENKIIIECLNKYGRVPEQWDLIKMINQLQSNWNSLREYIGKEWYSFDNESIEHEVAENILDKMQELEGKDKE